MNVNNHFKGRSMAKKAPRKTFASGGCKVAYIGPPVSTFSRRTPALNVSVSFEEALKLNPAIDECVRQLNKVQTKLQGRKEQGCEPHDPAAKSEYHGQRVRSLNDTQPHTWPHFWKRSVAVETRHLQCDEASSDYRAAPSIHSRAHRVRRPIQISNLHEDRGITYQSRRPTSKLSRGFAAAKRRQTGRLERLVGRHSGPESK